MDKATLRAAVLARRPAIADEVRTKMGRQLLAEAGHIAELARTFSSQPVVSGFWPIRGEPDCRLLLGALSELGVCTCLPVVDGASRLLAFRTWSEGDPVQSGRFGIGEPVATSALVSPDLLLVPCAAFDIAGHRIGYGAGYYDATLESLRSKRSVFAIALAFEEQRVAQVPHEAHDQIMDAILTENTLQILTPPACV